MLTGFALQSPEGGGVRTAVLSSFPTTQMGTFSDFATDVFPITLGCLNLRDRVDREALWERNRQLQYLVSKEMSCSAWNLISPVVLFI